jgi:hypothetical protein
MEKQPLNQDFTPLNPQASPPAYGQYQPAQQPQRTFDQPVYLQPIVVHQESAFSTGLALFVIGLIAPIAWWIGACCVGARTESDKTWQRVNRIMTGLTVAVIVFYVIAVIQITQSLPSEPYGTLPPTYYGGGDKYPTNNFNDGLN